MPGTDDRDGTVPQAAGVRLRRFCFDDASDLAKVFDDEYARRFYPDMTDVGIAARWIEKNLQRYEHDGLGLWALCLKGEDRLVGDCGLAYQDVAGRRELEVGYHLRADHRGQGLITGAALDCMEYGWANTLCERIVSMVHPDNDASQRVANRIHSRSGRFERLGDLYYLYYTERRQK